MNERWWEEAACRGTVPVDAFFMEHGRYPSACQEACHHCPVYLECFDWALRHENHGFWAGTTPKMREKIRRQRGSHLARPDNPDAARRLAGLVAGSAL